MGWPSSLEIALTRTLIEEVLGALDVICKTEKHKVYEINFLIEAIIVSM